MVLLRQMVLEIFLLQLLELTILPQLEMVPNLLVLVLRTLLPPGLLVLILVEVSIIVSLDLVLLLHRKIQLSTL